MKRLALALLALVALPALAQDTATNAPAATLARAEADLRGETFERWRFAVLTDLDALEASYGELRNFFGQLGVSWPPGSSMERSGDHGFVVRNTRENLNAIRMILDILPVTVLWGELVVLEDAPATNAPAATSARAETFERWRFTILPGLDGRVDSTDTWKSFFGQLGVSWPRGSFVEPSGDDGLVVRNTRENLDTIRMALGALSVTVLQGEPVVLEDAPATNAPAAALAPAEVDAASDCARFLESAFREIDPGTNGAPAAVVLGDLGWSMACESSISSNSGSAVRHCPWHPEAGERIVIPDKTELTLHIGKHQFVRIARLPLDTNLRESLDEKDRAVADGVGGPLLVVERRENYSSFGHAERNVAIRHFILPPGAREGHPFHPPAGAPARFLFADLAPAHAEPVPHAAPAEEEPHAESAENAEPDPHAEPAWGDAMYFLDLLEWQKRNPDAFAAALAALAKDFATNAPVAEEMQ